jgi:ryanodine receptor 2
VQKFSEHYHDAWAKRKIENGWNFGDAWSDETKSHPRLKPPHMLSDYERERYREPIRDSLKALVALGWSIEFADYDAANSNRNSMRRSSTVTFVSLSEKVFFIIIYLINPFVFRTVALHHIITIPTQWIWPILL